MNFNLTRSRPLALPLSSRYPVILDHFDVTHIFIRKMQMSATDADCPIRSTSEEKAPRVKNPGFGDSRRGVFSYKMSTESF
jgi:hypothetical protein